MPSILYCGWVGRGNLGDDYMWHVFKALCQKYDPKNNITVTPTTPDKDWNIVSRKYNLVVLGGGSVIDEYYINFVQRAIKLNIPIAIFGSGIDRVGLKKLETLLNGNAKLANNYLSKELQIKLKEVIPATKTFAVRGPLTCSILNHLEIETNKVHISGDPGILINDNDLFGNRIQIETRKLPIIKPCIAVNWGTSYNRIYGKNEVKLRNNLSLALRYLCDAGYHLLLYSVWKKDNATIRTLKKEINRPDSVQLMLNTTVDKLLSVLPLCEYSINFKLHANILSLASGTPCIALGYRFKVYDFFHSIDLPQLILPSQSDQITQAVLDLHHYMKENRQSIISTYKLHEQTYKEKLVSEFEKIMAIVNDI